LTWALAASSGAVAVIVEAFHPVENMTAIHTFIVVYGFSPALMRAITASPCSGLIMT
jgi:hypothetical protein